MAYGKESRLPIQDLYTLKDLSNDLSDSKMFDRINFTCRSAICEKQKSWEGDGEPHRKKRWADVNN